MGFYLWLKWTIKSPQVWVHMNELPRRLCVTPRSYTTLQKWAIATTFMARINASAYLLREINFAKADFSFFSPFWMERKTSSTWFNRVSLCIIVPKVAVFYFLAFCANIIQFLWPSQIFAAWLTLLNWAVVWAEKVCLASSTAQTRQ